MFTLCFDEEYMKIFLFFSGEILFLMWAFGASSDHPLWFWMVHMHDLIKMNIDLGLRDEAIQEL